MTAKINNFLNLRKGVIVWYLFKKVLTITNAVIS